MFLRIKILLFMAAAFLASACYNNKLPRIIALEGAYLPCSWEPIGEDSATIQAIKKKQQQVNGFDSVEQNIKINGISQKYTLLGMPNPQFDKKGNINTKNTNYAIIRTPKDMKNYALLSSLYKDYYCENTFLYWKNNEDYIGNLFFPAVSLLNTFDLYIKNKKKENSFDLRIIKEGHRIKLWGICWKVVSIKYYNYELRLKPTDNELDYYNYEIYVKNPTENKSEIIKQRKEATETYIVHKKKYPYKVILKRIYPF
jgi:hypothetical protein